MTGFLYRLYKNPEMKAGLLSMSLYVLDIHDNIVVADGILFDKSSLCWWFYTDCINNSYASRRDRATELGN